VGHPLRRSHDRRAGQAALHLVSAWVSANRLVLGAVSVADKSNESAALPVLIRLLDLEGAASRSMRWVARPGSRPPSSRSRATACRP
jgi:hypothetical protein